MPALYASKRSPPRWRRNPSAIWLLAEFCVHRNNTLCFLVSTSLPPSAPSGSLPYLDRLRRSPSLELIRELVGQLAAVDGIDCPLQVVLDPHELHRSYLLAGLDKHVSRPPVPILGFPPRAGVEETHSFDEPVPGLVGVAEGDQVALLGSRRLGHLVAEGVGSVLRPVKGVEGGGSVHQGQRRAALVSAPGSQVHPEGQRPEEALGFGGDMRPGPLVGEVGEFLTPGTFGFATAVGVVRCCRGVVVARDTRDAALSYQGNDLVGPGGVAHQVAEVVDRVHPLLLRVYVLQDR